MKPHGRPMGPHGAPMGCPRGAMGPHGFVKTTRAREYIRKLPIHRHRAAVTGTYFCKVEIVEVADSHFVKIRGTSNMSWLTGWIKATDFNDYLVFDSARSCDIDHG